jgi:hypothetical protein
VLNAEKNVIKDSDKTENDFSYIESVLDGKTSAGHRENSSDEIHQNIEY